MDAEGPAHGGARECPVNDRLARVLTGLAVLTVAVIAAIVSFSHIEALALGHGQPIWDARFLPVSVDGLLVVSSLTLLAEARAQRPAPGLARAGLVLGVIATVAANVIFGIHAGPVGAVISAWPAIAFIISTEILVTQMRRAGGIPSRAATAETVADTVPVRVPGAVPVDVPDVEPGDVPASGVPPVPARRARTVAAGRASGRAPKRNARTPETVFAAEIERGELPSLRAIKTRARCGTDRARAIHDQLTATLEEAPEAA